MPVARVFLLLRRPPRRSTLFPFTTLFRSVSHGGGGEQNACRLRRPAAASSRRSDRTRADGTCSFLRSDEHTSELQSRVDIVCRLLLEKKNNRTAATGPRPPERSRCRRRGR